MGEVSQRIEVRLPASPPGGPGHDPSGGGALARIVRAVVGGVVLTATVVAGAVMGGVLMIMAGALAVVGLAGGLYLRWRLRRMIREQMREGGGPAPGEPFTFSGGMAGGRIKVFVHESGAPGGSGPASGSGAAPPSAEEPLDVEILGKDDA